MARTRGRDARRQVGRRVLLAALTLVGLVLMHGVGGHSAHAAEVHGETQAAAPHAQTSSTALTPPAETASHSCPAGCASTETAAPAGREGGDIILLTLCLAVLLGVTAALLLSRGWSGLALLQPSPSPRVPRRHPYGLRIHAPPDLHRLSVLRC